MYNIKSDLEEIRKNLTNMYIAFNNMNGEKSEDNRISDIYEDNIEQLRMDKIFLNSLRNNALSIFDRCNQLLMLNLNK